MPEPPEGTTAFRLAAGMATGDRPRRSPRAHVVRSDRRDCQGAMNRVTPCKEIRSACDRRLGGRDMVEHGRIRSTIAALAAGILVGGASLVNAGDGPLYTPLGTFTDGKLAKHVWTVVGAAKKLGIVTAISC